MTRTTSQSPASARPAEQERAGFFLGVVSLCLATVSLAGEVLLIILLGRGRDVSPWTLVLMTILALAGLVLGIVGWRHSAAWLADERHRRPGKSMARAGRLLSIGGILLSIGAGVLGTTKLWGWYTSPARVLARANHALAHGNYPKALRLAERYIEEQPREWEGYWVKGAAQSRLKRYAEARQTLRKAVGVDDTQMIPVRELARAYTEPALAKVQEQLSRYRPSERGTRIEFKKDIGALHEAANELAEANEALALGNPRDPKSRLDLVEEQGRNLERIADTYRILAREHASAASAENINLTEEARAEQRRLGEEAEKRADAAMARAKAVLFDVLREDSSRGGAAEALYRLAKQSNDPNVLAEIRKRILSMDSPPPTARMQMLVDDIMAARDKGGAFYAKLNQSAKVLDSLIEKNPKNVFAKRLRASVALALGQHATAEKLCQEILKLDRANPFAQLILARVMMHRGNVTDAERELYRLITRYNLWEDAFVAHAEAAKAVGKKQLAIQSAQRAIKLAEANKRDNTRARQILSDLMGETGHGDEALAEARRALNAAPNDGPALLRVIRLLQDGKQTEEAAKILADTRRKFASHPDVLWSVANGHRILGEHEEAKKIIHAIADMKATNSKACMAVANALARLGRGPEAERILLTEIQKNPDNGEACYALGRLYLRHRRLAQAIEMLRKAVELDPTSPAHRVELARVLFDTGDLAEAQTTLEGVDPSNEAAAVLRIQIAMARGQPVDSEQILSQVGGTARSALILALLSLRTGQIDRCIQICQAELRKQEPENPLSFRAILAQAYMLHGERDKAVAELTEALKSDSTRLAIYQMLARVLSQDRPPDKLHEIMRKIPGADESLVDMAIGGLLAGQNKHAMARVVYERLAERAGAPEDIRHRARVLLAGSLARENRLDDALKHLELLRGKKLWHRVALEAGARLQIQASRFDAAGKALEELRTLAVSERDGALLRRVLDLYLAMKAPDKAMSTSQQLLGMLPNDARTYLAQARVYLAQDKTDQAISSIRTAIEKQPGNFDVYVTLARLLDQAERREQALTVLDQLGERGKAGKCAAMLARGQILASWGLHAQAAEAFQKAGQMGYVKNSALRVRLGQALAALGKKDQAAQEFRAIPVQSRLYVQAQLFLADLADTPDASLAVLDALDKARPGTPQALAKRLDVLIRNKRSAEAAKTVKGLIDANKPVPLVAASLGVRAMIDGGDLAGAAKLCTTLAAAQSENPVWRQLAALLLLGDKPDDVAKLLPAADGCDARDATLGLCLAVIQNKRDDASKWHGRLYKLEQDLAKSTPPRSLPLRLKILASVAAGILGQATQDAKKVSSQRSADTLMAQEFVGNAAKDPKAAAEAALLLKADLAVALRLPQLGRAWAMKALETRPTCLLAAALVLQTDSDKQTQQKVLGLVKPADSPLVRMIRAGILLQDRQHAKAADAYAALAKEFPDDPVIEMQRAMATERAGRFEQALQLYTQIVKKTGNVAAANNAAYLVALRYPRDQGRLQQASEWTQKAVKLAPNMAALRDTMGWIAHLQGRNLYAREELRRAVRADPSSIENHYHLGVVEHVTGNDDLARWHLEAAVALGKKAEDEKRSLPASTQDAVKLAAQALTKLKKAPGPQTPTVRVGT